MNMFVFLTAMAPQSSDISINTINLLDSSTYVMRALYYKILLITQYNII